MNHWFLTFRDLLWFLIAIFPLGCFYLVGMHYGQQMDRPPHDRDMGGITSLIAWVGVVIQFFGILFLYIGIIK